MENVTNIKPSVAFWCKNCKIPLIIDEELKNKENACSLCNQKIEYLSTDLRPVFPKERLLFELMRETPLEFLHDSVWAEKNRYFVNGKSYSLSRDFYKSFTNEKIEIIKNKLKEYEEANKDNYFEKYAELFCKANEEHFFKIVNESTSFIKKTAEEFSHPNKDIQPQDKNIIVSFSGGKDSTVTASLVTDTLGEKLVHIFGNTSLEFDTTIAYAKRYRKDHPFSIFKVSANDEALKKDAYKNPILEDGMKITEQTHFYNICEQIGPPARMMRWCCSMFKTGPISRVLNNLFNDEKVLTFYGIRAAESVTRSKYKQVNDTDNSNAKIKKQVEAAPIFQWRDVDVWLYILSKKIDFNEAYKDGFTRVGCWCCPNNNVRDQFLAKIFMSEKYDYWRNRILIPFAKKIGKPDFETYVDDGWWKARQGGNGLEAAEDIKIKFSACTSEEHAQIYQLNKAPTHDFFMMFTPFGNVNFELGRKLVNEVLVLQPNSNIPILSITPFKKDEYEFSVKIKTLNVLDHDELQTKAGYQVRKFNACRRCLKCESICKFGAISIHNGEYKINPEKCRHCRMCVTSKFLDGGCIMSNYLATKKGK